MNKLQIVRLQAMRFWEADFHFSIFTAVHPNSFDLKYRYQRNFWKVFLILEGSGTEMINDTPYPFSPGMLFVIHPDDVTHFVGSPGKKIKVCNIIFSQKFLFFAGKLFPSHDDFLCFFQEEHPSITREKREIDYIQTASPEIKQLIRKMLKEFRLGKEMFESILYFELLELLCMIIRESEQKKRKNSVNLLAHRVMKELQEHYSDSIDMAYLTRKFLISRQYLTRCFHSVYGIGIMKSLQKIRLKAAYSQIQEKTNRKSIAEISAQCGFHDLSHFYRIFRTEFGISPASLLVKSNNL